LSLIAFDFFCRAGLEGPSGFFFGGVPRSGGAKAEASFFWMKGGCFFSSLTPPSGILMVLHLPILRFLLAFLLLIPAWGQEEKPAFSLPGVGTGGKVQSTTSFVSEVTAIAPGKPFTVALRLGHPEGWHSYYLNSGGIEKALEIEWVLPEGFSAGAIQWPAPKVETGLLENKSFYYSGSPVFLIDITPPASLATGSVAAIKASATWQICKTGQCLDEAGTFSLALPVKESAETDAAQTELFASARASHPMAMDDWKFKATNAGGTVILTVTPGSGCTVPDDVDFIPAAPFLASISEGSSVTKEGADWVFTLKRKTEDVIGSPIEQGKEVEGILISTSPFEAQSGCLSVLVPPTVIERAPPKPLSIAALLPILGGMLLGGLILNLMPCVFPVIGLKIMGFVQQSGEDRKKIVLHGIAFTGGVLLSFWVLSGILFALRSAAGPGQEIGWGYQLQNPWTVLVLMLLMFVLGLSMYGLFEIGASATGVGGKLQSKQGVSGSFFSGILATVVATPCSAPFLGVAIGAAIALPGLQFFLAFTAMGLGLAIPYLTLSIFPKLVDMLPRPGAWMESFKQAMSFLLFATAGFLLWVYAGQIGLENMLNVVFGLTAIAIAAWVFGRWHTPIRSGKVKGVAIVACLLFAGAGLKLTLPPEKSGLVWEKWSDARVKELLDEGKPVFVDFTAQWCATCQLNKKRAYPKEVQDLLKARGVVMLKGDKTNPDPAIDKKLEELKRTAIPVNVLYVPGKDPIITPELFGADYMKELIEKEVPVPEGEKTP
jgi:DsbC/DsbD-like thiol-disulfide interchange protein/cytochrome c biogenesis protein CcdA